jgi:hypothetical protein
MRDDEVSMIERHERQDGIENGYAIGMGLALLVVVGGIVVGVVGHAIGYW